jgi:hypothetical protein
LLAAAFWSLAVALWSVAELEAAELWPAFWSEFAALAVPVSDEVADWLLLAFAPLSGVLVEAAEELSVCAGCEYAGGELDAELLFVVLAEFEPFMSDGVLPALAAVPVLSDGVVVLACGGVELGVVLSGLVALGFVVLGLFGFVVVSGLVADGAVLDCGLVVVVVVVVLVVVESGVVVAELC